MHCLVNLAKNAVETYIEKGEIISPPEDLPDKFKNKKAGTFVTLKKEDKLRACIGTSRPTRENIAKEIISNAISASTKDTRFGAIKEEELPKLSYEVYVLEEPVRVKDIEELDPEKFGIVVKSVESSKSALLLPGLEGIDSPQKQVLVACRKAGINPKKGEVVLFKFRAQKFEG